MASNRHGADDGSYTAYDPPIVPAYAPPYDPGATGPGDDLPATPLERGRHRAAKQRGGTMARSGAVLGVGMIAAVGAGGMASAQDRPAAPISVPDPGRDAPAAPAASAAAFTEEAADAGEVLRTRIMQQAEHQQEAAEAAVQAAEARAAAERHHAMAAQQAAVAEAEAKAAAAARAAAARAAAAHAAAAAPAQAAPPQQRTHQAPQAPHAQQAPRSAPQAHRAPQPHRAPQAHPQAQTAASFTLPLTSYTLTAGFGRAGAMWSSHHHTGEDFAAPTGTPVRAVSGGTVTQAGWAGAYGYRVVLTLGDGTEVWYCHLSSMVITSGKVGAGTVIGRVGATGNVTGPHLHLEVRPGGGAPVDPLSWLRSRGLQP
ncbi:MULTISPECIES: M23 family metallopeptidase [Streptomyces]|uniref:M23ase beta-sheet core domain-containing protein n=1 Tax=Streptomyces luteosporeus TaxID=173856 RepID=A0ABN3U369_9ACTN